MENPAERPKEKVNPREKVKAVEIPRDTRIHPTEKVEENEQKEKHSAETKHSMGHALDRDASLCTNKLEGAHEFLEQQHLVHGQLQTH